MRVTVRILESSMSAVKFLKTLCDVFERYGIELDNIVSGDQVSSALTDMEVRCFAGEDTDKVVHVTAFCRDAAVSAAEKLVGVKYFSAYSVYGISVDEVKERVKCIGTRSIKLFVRPNASGAVVTVRYGERAPKIDVDEVLNETRNALADVIYATADEELENYIVHALSATGRKLAVAESFTGGGVSARLTSVPSASNVFKEGIVAYSEVAKSALLRVSAQTIAFDSAVSVNVAYQMASGLLKEAGVDVVAATTGYAGPDGADVGKCFIAVGDAKRINIFEYKLQGSREEITQSGVQATLTRLADYIGGK